MLKQSQLSDLWHQVLCGGGATESVVSLYASPWKPIFFPFFLLPQPKEALSIRELGDPVC